jgi:hypothetical protein
MQLLLLASPLPLSAWLSVRLLGLCIKTTAGYLITSVELISLACLTPRSAGEGLETLAKDSRAARWILMLCGSQQDAYITDHRLSYALRAHGHYSIILLSELKKQRLRARKE